MAEITFDAEEIQEFVDGYPIEPYWGSHTGLSEDHVDALLCEGEVGRMKVYDELYEYNCEHIWDCELEVLRMAIDEFNLDMEPSELRDQEVYVPVEIDLLRLAKYTKAYLALRLPVEHVMYFQDYEEVDEELEFFGIDPATLKEYYPEIEWPSIPERTAPLIKTDDIVDGWANFYSSGYWYAMLDAGDTLHSIIKGELSDKMILKKGASIILHDYWNGCSGIDATTLADLEVETKSLSNDGSDRYGIQGTCGLIDEAWNGELE